MKGYSVLKGLLITTNIPGRVYSTSGTFHHSDNSDRLTLYDPSLRAKFEKHPDFRCHVTRGNPDPFANKREDHGDKVEKLHAD